MKNSVNIFILLEMQVTLKVAHCGAGSACAEADDLSSREEWCTERVRPTLLPSPYSEGRFFG